MRIQKGNTEMNVSNCQEKRKVRAQIGLQNQQKASKEKPKRPAKSKEAWVIKIR